MTEEKNDHALVLNLETFHKHVIHRFFQKHAINTALGIIRQNGHLASIDLTDGYYLVHVAAEDQKYLDFQFEGFRYNNGCLSNGH